MTNGSVTRGLITLCASEHRTRVRIRANPGCGTPFVDTSRASARRWCSMKTCGALAKTRAYRAKLNTPAHSAWYSGRTSTFLLLRGCVR
ncbi:CGNR zinc finger domain-containing protein [Kitasatospora sp. NPDC048545]|uniref:CGNR zinc finger domain-containing protein n=1 Tax=Kitasatospora sp. NPDC048545 TaxID=3157208 RepID=UPI0033CACB67